MTHAIAKQRGHADFWEWPDKEVKEWGVAQEFLHEFQRNTDHFVVTADQHPGGQNHPPDLKLILNDGATWGVEITEFVDQKAIERVKPDRWPRVKWTDNKLTESFQRLIERKDNPTCLRGGPYDRYVLLVHTDEFELDATRLNTVLGILDFQTRLIDEIYTILSYDPGKEHCPLLRFTTRKYSSDRSA